MGKFIAVMPAAIIAMLLISLAEATFVLPGHLVSHDGPPKSFFEKIKYRLSSLILPLEKLLDHVSRRCNAVLDWFGEVVFLNVLKLSLSFPLLPISVGALMVFTAMGMIRSGWVAFEFFPQLDGKTLIAQIVYPDGTPAAITSEAARRMEQAIRDLSEEIASQESKDGTNLTPDPVDPNAPRGPVILTFLQVGSAINGDPAAGDRLNGSHVAQVQVEIHEATQRNVTSAEIIKRWRDKAGDFPGAERISFETANMGPGGKALEFKILAPAQDVKALEEAIEASKKALSSFAGVSDIRDDSSPGKIEYQFSIKDEAMSLGLTNENLSETVRNSYYGAEVMRLQRGRHEVKLMVRYPLEQRRSLSDMQELRVRGGDGKERPLSELADIEVTRGYSEINRLDQLRSITVSADVDTTQANAALVAKQLQDNLVPELMAKYPSLRFRWEGQQQETAESFFSLLIGFIVALMTMYLLLVFEFRSYLQPFIILAIIPFSIVGAIFGHALMGLPLTLFSMFGMVTLAGVVVNDSIVLVDFINHSLRDGMAVDQALLNAGSRRLRAVFLTSVTTVAGLLPMLLEKSLQAQALIPMATSLAFGLIGSTLLVLVMVPLLFKFYTVLTFSPEQVSGKGSDCNDLAIA
jgi:multidrug efflux pump subunit AcrB